MFSCQEKLFFLARNLETSLFLGRAIPSKVKNSSALRAEKGVYGFSDLQSWRALLQGGKTVQGKEIFRAPRGEKSSGFRGLQNWRTLLGGDDRPIVKKSSALRAGEKSSRFRGLHGSTKLANISAGRNDLPQ